MQSMFLGPGKSMWGRCIAVVQRYSDCPGRQSRAQYDIKKVWENSASTKVRCWVVVLLCGTEQQVRSSALHVPLMQWDKRMKSHNAPFTLAGETVSCLWVPLVGWQDLCRAGKQEQEARVSVASCSSRCHTSLGTQGQAALSSEPQSDLLTVCH